MFMQLGVGRVLKGVVLEHGRRRAYPADLAQLTQMAPGQRAARATVVGALTDAWEHHGGIGKRQPVGATFGVFELVKVEAALFGGQAFDKRQIGFPVLHQVLPLSRVGAVAKPISVRPRSSASVVIAS